MPSGPLASTVSSPRRSLVGCTGGTWRACCVALVVATDIQSDCPTSGTTSSLASLAWPPHPSARTIRRIAGAPTLSSSRRGNVAKRGELLYQIIFFLQRGGQCARALMRRFRYPMVDAGMRCLWATGWIHQSVRMVTASFLVEYLGVSWVEGARWYHDTLVDADVAINAMMWQVCHSSAFLRFSHVLARAT